MSEVMKALQQSEQGYQMSQPTLSPSNRQMGLRKKRGQWSLLIVVILAPALCSIGYQVYQTQQAWQEKQIQAKQQQQEAMLLAQQPVEPQVLYLDYPDFGELTPLSDIPQEQAKVLENTKLQEKVKLEANQKSLSSSTKLISAEPIAVPIRETLPDTEELTEQVQSASQQDESGLDLDALDLSELSPELALRVQSAFGVDDSANKHALVESQQEIIRLVDYPRDLRGRLPAMNLQYHNYTSNAQSRWVKINGQELQEGEWLDSQVKLLTISPRNIVVEFDGQQIEIPALYEWEG